MGERREREGRTQRGVKGRERLDAEMRQKGKEGKKDASREPKEGRFISVARAPRARARLPLEAGLPSHLSLFFDNRALDAVYSVSDALR